MRNNKNRTRIILAVTVAILATIISYSTFRNMHNQLAEQQKLISLMQATNKPGDNSQAGDYAYAVATVGLKAGEIVADTDVDFKSFKDINTAAFENRSEVVNKVLLKDIASGEIFTTSHIAKISSDDVSLKEGYRALTLPADNFQGKADTMTQGSLVDIYSTSSDNNLILEGIKILSFDSGTTSSNTHAGITGASSITFEVPANDIPDFISTVSKSKLMLVARNPNDKKVFHKLRKSNSYGANSIPTLPKNLPASVPIHNLGNLSGLPQPLQPTVQSPTVEVIEANVKSKVTFD